MSETAETVYDPTAEVAEFVDKLQRGFRTLSAIRDEDVEIATSEKEVVYTNGKMSLYRYKALAPQQAATPLLIVYSQIGRYTMMDLQPDRSLVRNLLERGIDVYLVDWGNPNRSDRWLRFDDYVEDYIASCVDEICANHGVSQISLLGVCEGGVFVTCYAALHPERVANLALAVTPIDFHADLDEPENLEQGYMNRWARNLSRTELEELIDSYGQMPGQVTGMMFREMTPVQTITKYNWDFPDAISGSQDEVMNFLRMEKWLSDRPHHPAEAAKQWLVELYLENRLANGAFEIDGEVIHLGNLTMPILNVFATKDHIVPPPTSRALRDHVSTTDYQELELSAGHIGTFVSRKANRLFSEKLANWLLERPPTYSATFSVETSS